MTGFGKSIAELPNKKVTIEIKSLNSNRIDLSTRISSHYREYEMTFRNLIAKKLERGKVDLNIYVESISSESSSKTKTPSVKSYYNMIKEAADCLGIDVPSDWFQILLKMPESIKTEIQTMDETELHIVENAVNDAINKLCE